MHSRKGNSFSNSDVLSEMVRAVKADGWDEAYKALTDTEKLLKAVWSMKEDKAAKMIHDVHTAHSSSLEEQAED